MKGNLTAKDSITLKSAADIAFTGDIIGSGDANVTNVNITALGTNSVMSATAADMTGTVPTSFTSTPSGFITLKVGKIDSGNLQLRASKDISVDVASDFTFGGFIGGLTGTNLAGTVNLTSSGSINSLTGSLLAANKLDVSAANAITLNTTINSLTALSSTLGSISVTDTDINGINLDLVQTRDGGIVINSAGNITATQVITGIDSFDNNITLTSTKDMNVGYVEAGVDGGSQKLMASVVLSAGGTLHDINIANEYKADVLGYVVTFVGNTVLPPVQLKSSSSHGTGANDIEYATTIPLQTSTVG
jgi:hypothetical protein